MEKNNSKIFRSAMDYVAKHHILPLGFTKGVGRSFFLADSDVLLCISFQPSVKSSVYFVNIAFHYRILPGLLSFRQGKKTDEKNYVLLDYLMYVRLEHAMHYPYPREWDVTVERQQLYDGILLNFRNAIACLNEQAKKLGSAADFMRAISPDDLRRQIEQSNSGVEPVNEIDSHRSLPPVSRLVGTDWYLEEGQLVAALVLIAKESGRYGRANEYLDVFAQHPQKHFHSVLIRKLRSLIKE